MKKKQKSDYKVTLSVLFRNFSKHVLDLINQAFHVIAVGFIVIGLFYLSSKAQKILFPNSPKKGINIVYGEEAKETKVEYCPVSLNEHCRLLCLNNAPNKYLEKTPEYNILCICEQNLQK